MEFSFPSPVFSYTDPDGIVSIRSYGAAVSFDPTESDQISTMIRIEELAHLGEETRHVLWQRLPNERSSPERRCAVREGNAFPTSEGFVTHGVERFDAVIIKDRDRGKAVAFITKDCHVGVLWSKKGGDIGVFHWGRGSAQCADLGYAGKSVLWNVVNKCRGGWKGISSVQGVLTTGIAPKHFNNERHPGMVKALERLYGRYETIVPNRARFTVDMVALLRAQCAIKGIKPEHILHDGIDTYSDPRCSSLRAENNGVKPESKLQNLVIVTKL